VNDVFVVDADTVGRCTALDAAVVADAKILLFPYVVVPMPILSVIPLLV